MCGDGTNSGLEKESIIAKRCIYINHSICFKSEKSADDYIIENAKILTINDISCILRNSNISYGVSFLESIKKTIRSRL